MGGATVGYLSHKLFTKVANERVCHRIPQNIYPLLKLGKFHLNLHQFFACIRRICEMLFGSKTLRECCEKPAKYEKPILPSPSPAQSPGFKTRLADRNG